ncbi:hypothetical protein SC610_09315 [Legionella pneumophila serogroup 1]
MLDFCIKSLLDELNKKDKSLKEYFLSRQQNNKTQLEPKELSQKIVEIESLRMLYYFSKSHQGHPKDIYDEIIELKNKYTNYLDSSDQEFDNGLKSSFTNRVFELIIAKLINESGFKLITNPNQAHSRKNKDHCPDIYFDDFFIECRLNNSNFLYDWDKLLPDFDKYEAVLEQVLKKRSLQDYEHPCNSIAQIWHLLDKQIENWGDKLGCQPSDVHDKLNDWVLLNHHIRCYWNSFIPEETQNRLDRLNIKRTSSRNIDNEFIGKRVIQSLFDKVCKGYFQSTKKGYVAISTTFLIPGLQLSEKETAILVDFLSNNYQKLCYEVMSSNTKYDQNKIVMGIGNLMGVVLDTNWYNWFPTTLKKHGLSHFSHPDQQNFYCLLYNQSNINQSHLIKLQTTIQNHIQFNFTIELGCKFPKDHSIDKSKEIVA